MLKPGMAIPLLE